MSGGWPTGAGGGVPERWLVLRLPRPTDPDRAALAVEELLALPARGVEERDGELVVYLPPPEEADPAPLLERLARRLAPVLGEPPAIDASWQPHELWEERWRQGLGPRRVTPRLVVSPSWCEPELRPGEILLTIDPGMAFGTAEHPTTRGSLALLDLLVEPGDRIADIGAGSGILSIAAARLGATQVVAVEMDPWSCEAARENVEVNGVGDAVRIVKTAVDPAFLPDEPPFDGVVANIESGVLRPLLPGFLGGLLPGGWLVLSGILEGEADEIRSAAESEGFRFAHEIHESGWWSGAFLTAASADGGGSSTAVPGSGPSAS